MRTRSLAGSILAMVTAGLLLSACDEAEQGRILRYQKGTYLGQPDSKLTAEQQAELRARTRMQQGN